jgi:hypothetical protein
MLTLGAVLMLIGGILMVADKVGLGRLPGDLSFRFKNVTVHLPLATGVLVSVVLTVVLNFWLSRR